MYIYINIYIYICAYFHIHVLTGMCESALAVADLARGQFSRSSRRLCFRAKKGRPHGPGPNWPSWGTYIYIDIYILIHNLGLGGGRGGSLRTQK